MVGGGSCSTHCSHQEYRAGTRQMPAWRGCRGSERAVRSGLPLRRASPERSIFREHRGLSPRTWDSGTGPAAGLFAAAAPGTMNTPRPRLSGSVGWKSRAKGPAGPQGVPRPSRGALCCPRARGSPSSGSAEEPRGAIGVLTLNTSSQLRRAVPSSPIAQEVSSDGERAGAAATHAEDTG